MLARTPPRLAGGGLTGIAGTGATLFRLARLGRRDVAGLLRVILLNIDDLLRDEIADGPLAGATALDAVLGGFSGPRSPGNVLVALYRRAHGGARHLPRGGMGALGLAMRAAAERAGCEPRTSTGVAAILFDDDNHVSGVRLEDGASVAAGLVLSNLDAPATLRLTGTGPLDVEATRRISNIRAKATTAKLNLALSARPNFTGLSASQHQGRIVIAPSMRYVEQAFNHAKYGEISPRPALEITIPSLADASLVDAGLGDAGDGQVLSVIAQYVPIGLQGGWSDTARAQLQQAVMAVLEDYAPGIGKLVLASQLLTPADIETAFGATGGHWHHGELVADQMAMLRPANMMARYSMGPPGLYLCGAAAHPGGDVMGLAGRNAARQALKDRRKTDERVGNER